MRRDPDDQPGGDFWSRVDRPGGPRRRRGVPSSVLEARALWDSSAGRVLLGVVATIAVAAVVGLVLLWPGADPATQGDGLGTTSTATVRRVIDGPCAGGPACRRIVADVSGTVRTITVGPLATAPALSPGERVRVNHLDTPRGGPAPSAAAVNTQTVAEPVVAAIVGCAALLVAVPITTSLAAALASRLPVESISEGHSHAH